MRSRQLVAMIAMIALVLSPRALQSQERVASSDVAVRNAWVADSGEKAPNEGQRPMKGLP